jgi:hypothetical protein
MLRLNAFAKYSGSDTASFAVKNMKPAEPIAQVTVSPRSGIVQTPRAAASTTIAAM